MMISNRLLEWFNFCKLLPAGLMLQKSDLTVFTENVSMQVKCNGTTEQ